MRINLFLGEIEHVDPQQYCYSNCRPKTEVGFIKSRVGMFYSRKVKMVVCMSNIIVGMIKQRIVL